MYNAQIVKDRLKERQKVKGIKNSDTMMQDLSLGVNIIRQMTDKKGVGCFALAEIADYLDCSVDYLLGRTDIPDMVVRNENVINGVTVASPIQVIGAEKEKPLDGLTAEFLKQFRELSYSDKLEIMSIVANKYKMVK